MTMERHKQGTVRCKGRSERGWQWNALCQNDGFQWLDQCTCWIIGILRMRCESNGKRRRWQQLHWRCRCRCRTVLFVLNLLLAYVNATVCVCVRLCVCIHVCVYMLACICNHSICARTSMWIVAVCLWSRECVDGWSEWRLLCHLPLFDRFEPFRWDYYYLKKVRDKWRWRCFRNWILLILFSFEFFFFFIASIIGIVCVDVCVYVCVGVYLTVLCLLIVWCAYIIDFIEEFFLHLLNPWLIFNEFLRLWRSHFQCKQFEMNCKPNVTCLKLPRWLISNIRYGSLAQAKGNPVVSLIHRYVWRRAVTILCLKLNEMCKQCVAGWSLVVRPMPSWTAEMKHHNRK